MFGSALIVFRETLEAALFIGIVAAATRGIAGRSHWVAVGVAGGLIGSLLLAAGMDQLSHMASGAGQDLVNATFLCLALGMLAWHCIWVSPHAQEMVQHAHRVGQAATNNHQALWPIALAVGLCVLREGAETALFIGGIAASAQSGWPAMLAGACIGLAAGISLGLLLYLGLTRIQIRHVFWVSNALLLLLAASMASQLAKVLSQAGWVQVGTEVVWDGSAVLPNESALGLLLHAMVGYDDSPTSLQLGLYTGAILAIGVATRFVHARIAAERQAPVTAKI